MAKKTKSGKKTNERIRLGIWGLGRGMSFYRACEALDIDVVAGCDYNPHMRENFLKEAPNARATDDMEEFLSWDFDAVLLATYCQNHADDAIACLNAGKHVLSEVTSFHTMAEGVRLVEAVEKSGLVYNLAENYPFSKENMYLARKWREGLFGDLMYAEYEYVHECRFLVYTYIDAVPVMPGNTIHNWRGWLNYHFYNTHSLGPMMIITDTRPTRVTALMGEQQLPGFPMAEPEGDGLIAPSLINMSNGAVVRNLMGTTTNDTHQQRLWGTNGSAEISDGTLRLRLGGYGGSWRLEVKPEWDEMGELAEKSGHGGGDFWVLYYFARQIRTGEAAPFDLYNACDCTSPGILAYRSSREGGTPYDVPDFSKKKDRDKWRKDDFACPRYDVDKGCFPKNADYKLTGRFTTLMRDLSFDACHVRAWLDWCTVEKEMTTPAELVKIGGHVVQNIDRILATYRESRALADAYPRSDGARLLREMLEVGREDLVLKRNFLANLKKEHARLKRRHGKG